MDAMVKRHWSTVAEDVGDGAQGRRLWGRRRG
jgi:hypothetical protein